jgi:hypothetical protein
MDDELETPDEGEDDDEWMTDEDAARWRSGRTLADLADLTALWLEGTIDSRYGYYWRPAPETIPLIGVLAATNRAGYLTDDSQPGVPRDESGNAQRAAVTGYATTETLCKLCRQIADAGLILIAHTPAIEGNVQAAKVTVTLEEGETYTTYGGHMPRELLRDHYGKGFHPAALEALFHAWQVTLVDPEWGRNDVLWPALQRFANAANESGL